MDLEKYFTESQCSELEKSKARNYIEKIHSSTGSHYHYVEGELEFLKVITRCNSTEYYLYMKDVCNLFYDLHFDGGYGELEQLSLSLNKVTSGLFDVERFTINDERKIIFQYKNATFESRYNIDYDMFGFLNFFFEKFKNTFQKLIWVSGRNADNQFMLTVFVDNEQIEILKKYSLDLNNDSSESTRDSIQGYSSSNGVKSELMY
jgi:hypothetical protein